MKKIVFLLIFILLFGFGFTSYAAEIDITGMQEEGGRLWEDLVLERVPEGTAVSAITYSYHYVRSIEGMTFTYLSAVLLNENNLYLHGSAKEKDNIYITYHMIKIQSGWELKEAFVCESIYEDEIAKYTDENLLYEKAMGGDISSVYRLGEWIYDNYLIYIHLLPDFKTASELNADSIKNYMFYNSLYDRYKYPAAMFYPCRLYLEHAREYFKGIDEKTF